MERIGVKHIREIQGNHEDFLFINVLSEESFKKEHIPGSINIPFHEGGFFVQNVESVTPNKNYKIILYSDSKTCQTSAAAAKALDEKGFSYVMDFEGGLQEWKEAGESITRS